MSSRTLIFCGAFSGELDPFREMDGSVVEEGLQISLRSCGIGNVSAALSVMNWQQQARKMGRSGLIAEILFIGSCGIYDAGLVDVPAMVFSRSFCSFGLASLMDPPQAKSLSVSGLIETQPGPVGIKLAQGIPEVAANAPEAVSLRPVGSDRLRQLTGSALPFVENLEVFGMARACLECQIPFSALMAVTNVVDEDGSASWQRNYGKGARMLEEHVQQMLFSKK